MQFSLFPKKLGVMSDKARINMLEGQLREARAEISRLKANNERELHDAIKRGDVA